MVTVRLEPASREDELHVPPARESAIAAASAIALVLIFVVAAIVVYWVLIFRAS